MRVEQGMLLRMSMNVTGPSPTHLQVEFLNLLLIVRWNVQHEDLLIDLIQILSGNQYQNLNRLCSLR